jgi:hypothetical protein
MSVWQAARAADAALTRTVTGAILAPHKTQRLVVSGKTGIYSSRSPRKSKCGPIDYGRRNGDTFFFSFAACVRPSHALCNFELTILRMVQRLIF